MTFTVTSLTRCAGQDHWHLDINITSPAIGAKRITVNRTDIMDAPTDFDEARERIITRCRSRGKEQGAATFAAAKTALEGQTFQV